mgnify:CR=1 FL=1
MEVLRDPSALGSLRGPVYLAIGIFDGVHRGHQALIAEAQADAARSGGTAVVMTFEPHPMMYFQHAEPPLRLSSPRHKELLLARIGVTHLAVLPFEAMRAAQAPEEFVADLVAACRPLGGICVGAAWRFGRGRTGDIALLQELGRQGGFEVDGIPAVRLRGEVISSTVIRVAVARGDLDYAEAALGRPYAVLGEVVPGRKLGRRLGYPTANIDPDGFQLPPDGVYAASVKVDGVPRRAMVNLGCRPTVGGEPERVLEAHILGFGGDLYGRELEVEFLRFLRPEKKFASLDDLRVQIARDIAEAQ